MTWATYAGIEVITAQFVPVRHPRWGRDKLATLKNASLLLLADETELVVCDVCGFNALTKREPYVKPEGEYKPPLDQADSMMSHINGMHHSNKPNRRTSFYDDAKLRVIIRTFLKWKTLGVKNYTQCAADELDRRGILPRGGGNWNVSQLGSLVRAHMKEAKFKNLKAGPMSLEDHEVLARVVRAAALREGAAGPDTSVASNARITEDSKPHQHERIDFEQIISEQQARALLLGRQEEEEDVAAAADEPGLTLNFAGRGAGTPVKTLVISKEDLDEGVVSNKIPTMPTMVPPPPSPYEHIIELPDGTPMFKFNGVLYAGKLVKGVDI